jgi:hypothetical protein
MDDQRLDNPASGLGEEELKRVVEQLCNSKAEEFAMLGYEGITGQEIWDCVSEKYRKGTPALHQLVNDILSLKTTQFMNWITINTVYKGARP